MSSTATSSEATLPGVPPPSYVVVARRYRPQVFGELIGQEHVAQALSNAISTHRVGHAYLFTGARGVGKTSAARILAKALNCEKGPTPVPCNQCDICQSISAGEDVDVLEIDGASNRGIDEIRQLRQNAGVRPSRSRFKIYIIDEVHMLTREAFNALLKTLEEPPEHVKFIFCTTEPTKIPITILSRCQRFDFAGILTGSIHQRLAADRRGRRGRGRARGPGGPGPARGRLDARQPVAARTAAGLFLGPDHRGRRPRDARHGRRGAAGNRLLGHLIERNPAGALADLDAAMSAGVDAGQLIEQLFGSLARLHGGRRRLHARDVSVYVALRSRAVSEAGKRLGLNTLLAIMQILDQTLSRMRYSTQGRILAELALVRICQLEDLDELSEVIAQLQSGAAVAPSAGLRSPDNAVPASTPGGVKKKYEPLASSLRGDGVHGLLLRAILPADRLRGFFGGQGRAFGRKCRGNLDPGAWRGSPAWWSTRPGSSIP